MSKLDKLKASAKKEKAESVAADKALEVAKKEVAKKHIALSCTEKELVIFKKHKAV